MKYRVDTRDDEKYDTLLAMQDAEIQRLRALLREAWMLTGGADAPVYLREFHDRLDAQAYELGLRLPR